jgi:hypothetical protein
MSLQIVKFFDNLNNKKFMTDWEKDFADSIVSQLTIKGELSGKQEFTVGKIKTSVEKKRDEHKSWCEEFGPGHRENWEVVSSYVKVKKTEWFYGWKVANKYTKEELPTRNDYNYLVNNKYTKKVIKGWRTDARFGKGELVQLRKISHGKRVSSLSPTYDGINYDYGNVYVFNFNTTSNKRAIFLVVEPNSFPPISACSGNKVYKLLPMNISSVRSPVYLEERMLKKM